MKTDELREKYLAFFESKGHTRCPSDVLVPTWDPSVLFTPAGMNQFKDHFLGKVKLEFSRATTCQKCMRTSDIDKVGRTAYHHTFFEMLGNFSFGDYFKRDAIRWAWEFLTHKKWLGIDPGRLSVTVYEDDAEAAEIWAKDIGLASDRIQRMDEDDNFWPASAPSQGPDGVCGPCSEIFYHPDQGAEVEIWNLVFTQFNRVGDPPGNLKPLPSKNIDTGMGLERTVAMLQGVDTNFHIDSLLPIVKAAAEVCGKKYEPDSDDGRRLRRITDHVRACTFAVHENVYPGPNKEKYVIKRLLRRAVLDGRQMGIRGPFLHRIVPKVAEVMKGPYPELTETITRVRGVIEKEEANFFATIDAGLERIYRVFDEMRRDRRMRVDGGVAAELYQTYGVPPELMESLAAERQLTFDWDGYARAMQEHGEASGKMQHAVMGGRKGPLDSLKGALHATAFVGYDTTETTATVLGLIVGDAPHDRLVDDVSPGPETVRVVLDRTPFYAESGGQVGDQGLISSDAFTFHVQDTQRDGDLVVHIGRVDRGTLRAGCSATATVAADRREGIRRAHSATHILHYALQKNLGSHAQQQGSKVDRDWLRFDFSNLTPVDPQQLDRIEQDVYQCVVNKAPISWKTLPLAEARAAGAMMLFGEKYPDPVRMVSMGNFSKELCGGTHLTCTDQVGPFEIIAEEGISAGTRRVVALTGERAREHRQQTIDAVTKAAEIMQVAPAELENAVPALTQQIRSLKKQLAGGEASPTKTTRGKATKRTELDYAQQRVLLKVIARQLNAPMLEVPQRLEAMRKERGTLEQELALRQRAGGVSADELIAAARDIGGAKVIVAELPMVGSNLMRQLIDQIRKSVSPSAVLFASREGERKVTLVAGVSRELVDRKISAGNWVKEVAPVVGGGGGGKADMAQAGGKLPQKTPAALEKATEWIAAALA